MGDKNGPQSVYELVTELCQKFAYRQNAQISHKFIKKLRSKGYEILLRKTTVKQEEYLNNLENNEDPFCQLLAWEFELIIDHGMEEHANKLKEQVEKLQCKYGENNTNINNVLSFLLHLRKVPSREFLTVDPFIRKSNTMFRYFDNNKFKLQSPMICSDYKYTDSSFCMKEKSRVRLKKSVSTNFIAPISSQAFSGCSKPSKLSCRTPILEAKDEGYVSPTQPDKEDNIWEIVSKSKITNRRIWEHIGHCSPKQELPFLTEAGPAICSSAYHLIEANIGEECTRLKKVVNPCEFVKCLKFLLVGMESKYFKIDEEGKYILIPNINMEGLTTTALESYCKDFKFSGYCYKGLEKMCTIETHQQGGGYIFAEFCESIKRYLSFYRTAAFSIPESTNLLALHEKTKQLRAHLSVLSSICKVGPFTESEHIPHGVALLNYLYQKVLSLTDKETLLVLYSILYPCCQVYFSRFLQQWIFEGKVTDPYKEFFIGVTEKYISTHGRTYWTRSYTLQQDIVPDFLTDLKDDILNCGKSINLLKLCIPESPLCKYLMGKQKLFFSCCLTSQQLLGIEQNAFQYYLGAIEECGPKFTFTNVLTRSKEQEDIFLSLVAQKRATTFKRIELEKVKKLEELNEKKLVEMKTLRDQYDLAVATKESQRIEEIEREIKINEANMKLQQLRKKLIQMEANNIIEYYNKLFEVSEKRKESIDRNITRLKKIHIDGDIYEKFNEQQKPRETKVSEAIDKINAEESSNKNEENYSMLGEDSEISIHLEKVPHKDDETEEQKDSETAEMMASTSSELTEGMPSSNSLDLLNANVEEDKINAENELLRNMAEENFRIARRNKEKVLNLEMGITFSDESTKYNKTKEINENFGLTDAQKNKLRVMSSEFGIDIKKVTTKIDKKSLSTMEVNRQKNMKSDECFYMDSETGGNVKTTLDNENFLNKNILGIGDNIDVNKNEPEDNGDEVNEIKGVPGSHDKESRGKMERLSLNLVKTSHDFVKSPGIEPMSIGSTPMSDLVSSSSPYENKLRLNIGKAQYEALPSCSLAATAATNFTDDGFDFSVDKSNSFFDKTQTDLNNTSSTFTNEKLGLSKRVSILEAREISANCSKPFIQESVAIPLSAQLKLADNALLKYFVHDLQYLNHLNSLRSYFFLLDGEFGRNITESLFEKLYDVNFPIDLINCRTLQNLVYGALDSSCRYQENSTSLSFKINNLPKSFNLGDPNVLDCLSLTYQVFWPLNVLLPSDTIGKYDEVFKYLIKLHRVSWVLKKIFQELKFLAHETGTKEIYLMISPQYQRLHQFRHVMTHFMQTLQNYVVGEVLQMSWEIFEKDLTTVTNLDQVYALHTTYIKNILFMCLLNQRSAPIRQVIQKIFTLILKFYDFLRSRSWEYCEGIYTHPNFKKLEDIFQNFEQFVLYLFKVCKKVAKSGYQPALIQFLDMLDVNNYYSTKIAMSSSLASSST